MCHVLLKFTPSSPFIGYQFQVIRRLRPKRQLLVMATSYRPSSDLSSFREKFGKAKHVVVLTGAGVSAESGVPTFRGAGGLWRTFRSQDLATPQAFRRNPSLVWEFYHHRREVMHSKAPNAAHVAIAQAETRLAKEGRRLSVITQNVDELHKAAGTRNLIELHGTLFKTRCTDCGSVCSNYDSPICPALDGRGAPDAQCEDARIPTDALPRCTSCSGLLRPHIVWFGEDLDADVLQAAEDELDTCDLCLVVGTSAIVYPAAMFTPQVAARGVPVAEFNIETTSNTNTCGYYFEGPCGKSLPAALAP